MSLYLCEHNRHSQGGGQRRGVPLERFALRLPAATQGPAHTQTQQHIQHLHLGHHVTDCTHKQHTIRGTDPFLSFHNRSILHNDVLKETSCIRQGPRDSIAVVLEPSGAVQSI